MYDDYLKLLRYTYNEKKKAGTLSGRLMNPTPGNLKKECINALNHRFEKKDEKALRDFFEQFGDNIVWERAIRKFETSRFKPLGSYLRGETNSTHDFNIEILAWLLGVKDRPYKSDIDYSKYLNKGSDKKTENILQVNEVKTGIPGISGNGISGESEKTGLSEEEIIPGDTNVNETLVEALPVDINEKENSSEELANDGNTAGKEKAEAEIAGNENKPTGRDTVSEGEKSTVPTGLVVIIPEAQVPVTDTHQPQENNVVPKKWKWIPAFRNRIAVIILPILIGTSLYLALNQRQSPGRCMYWTGDHYEKISCHSRQDTLVIALDSLKLEQFRKINKPDTITFGSIGFVWYSKINNNYEYFTAGGYHPIERGKKLKPITPFIIRNHILPMQTGRVFN
jgi:hypothetical protein